MKRHDDGHLLVSADRLQTAIDRGVRFLRGRQLPSGEFTTLVGPDPDLHADVQPDPSLFATMHVATSLLEVRHDDVAGMVSRAAEFLRSEMLPGGLWRFWTASHPGSPGIPPDTDDTACITHFLRRLGMPVPDNLCSLLGNRDRHGLLRTWIVPRQLHALRPRSWPMLLHARRNRDRIKLFFRSGPEPPPADGVDVVVNANALLVLGDHSAVAPIVAWVQRVLVDGTAAATDRWYQGELPLFYAIARGVEHGVQALAAAADLVREKAQRVDASGLTPLETALLASTVAILGGPLVGLDAAAGALTAAQAEDGSWPARAFYYSGFNRDLAWGSAELTTGLCVEALSRSLRRMH
jgi:hypothetical protein